MRFLVIVVVVLFVGFWMVQDPGGLAGFTAETAAWAWEMTTMLFSAVIDFTGRLFS